MTRYRPASGFPAPNTRHPPLYSLALALGLLTALPTAAQDKPFPPGEAAKHMTVPDGFHVTLFAGEPDVVQPIAFTIDDRGRLWVVESYSYPDWRRDGKEGRDRILIFEDRDGDGHFDTCKVFWDKGANISGIQVGFGGVWLAAIPNLLFIPDRDGDDVPDGPPEVLLDGWDLNAKHNVFNSLTWGPDGWLYGCNGISSNSRVGAPGTPDAQRVPLNCGVWRFHPTRKQFEAVAWGTTNPWGLDFDDFGQMFITNCVIKHLWHVVPGAHFRRMFGQDLNPNVYGLIESCADHIHWAGGPWESSRGGQGPHDETGGGHAHVGAMVYLGDNWPDSYRNGIFMCNLHGNRINHDVLERHGSGYVAHHGKDFLLAHDSWFRGIALQYGPDGGVFVTDWTDTGECHNYKEVDRSNGRIYKVTYGAPAHHPEDLSKLSDAELVQRQLFKNDWHVRHARRILQERAAAGKLTPDTRSALRDMLRDNPDVTRKLRALWALYAIGGVDEKLLLALLDSPQETVRAWAVQLGLEDRKASEPLRTRLAELAGTDPSPFVRLALASGLQRMPLDQRWPIAEALVRHAEDSEDAYLPLMNWYGIEPLVPAAPDRAVALIPKAQVPLVREYVARRVASLERLPPLVQLLERVDDPAVQADVLRGIQAALIGRRHVAMPESWLELYRKLAVSPRDEVRERALALAVLFGDVQAVESLRKVLMDSKAATATRQSALQSLLAAGDAELLPLLRTLVSDPELRGAALRGLAAYADAGTPELILSHYAALGDSEKSDAIQTLASRPAYALALLEAVERGRVPRRDLSAFTVRQMMGFNQKQISEKVTRLWGTIRPAAQGKAALLSKYKALLTPEYLKGADPQRGRQLFTRTCASCHRLFGEGGDVGPELTGSQRANLDYLLDNVLDPSAVVPFDYQATVVATRGGRSLTGIIKQEDDKTITLQTQNERIVLPKDEIETRMRSPQSMMPDGLLDNLKNEEVRDLVGYLASPSQVPLPQGPPAPREGS